MIGITLPTITSQLELGFLLSRVKPVDDLRAYMVKVVNNFATYQKSSGFSPSSYVGHWIIIADLRSCYDLQ